MSGNQNGETRDDHPVETARTTTREIRRSPDVPTRDTAKEWEMTVATEIGRRVHQVIGALADEDDVSPHRILETVRSLWAGSPVGGTTASSARLRCATAVSVYFQHCRPQSPWALDGVEVRVDGAIADLVWAHPEDGWVVVDELKSTITGPDSPDTADQLGRLAQGGIGRWGDQFLGVRLVPLGAPARTSVFNNVEGALAEVPAPEGFEFRD